MVAVEEGGVEAEGEEFGVSEEGVDEGDGGDDYGEVGLHAWEMLDFVVVGVGGRETYMPHIAMNTYLSEIVSGVGV